MRFNRISRSEQDTQFRPLALAASAPSDSLLDGVRVQRPSYATHWVLESTIHQTLKLSDDVENTRNLCGQQINMVRDEIRQKTWALHIEGEGKLLVSEVIGKKAHQKEVVVSGAIRSHLHVDKYDGSVFIVYIRNENDRFALYFGNVRIATEASMPDFPFFATDQAPIGHVPVKEITYGLLTYKDRATGKIYLRRFSNGEFQAERVLYDKPTVGGASFAVIGAQVTAFVFGIEGDLLVPRFSVSNDSGDNFSPFEDIEFDLDISYRVSPNSGAPTVDFSGVCHFPILLGNSDTTIVIDAIPHDQLAVEAIRVAKGMDILSRAAVDKFPKSSACKSEIMFDEASIPKTLDYRLGDGKTDGVGIIATLAVGGKLYSSNSQSGGRSYPHRGQLNHEMLDVSAYCTTECYSRGENPNAVSMDYMFMESIEGSDPVSGELHFETWDMPLPSPVFRATQINDTTIEVIIEKDANFIPGKTTFDIDDPLIAVIDVKWDDVRSIKLIIAKKKPDVSLKGKKLTFEARSNFYHHRATTRID